MQKWTREFIMEKTHRALKECDITKTTKLADNDIPLSIESFDWYNLWMHLEWELGTHMNFDPKGELTNTPNPTPNIIADFLYKELNAQKQIDQIEQKKSFFHRVVYSRTKKNIK